MELTYARDGAVFRAVEPDAELVSKHAATLRDWYNVPANASMMGNTVEMSRDDVLEYWAGVQERKARGFLLFLDDSLCGDAELRNVECGRAEFSIMIGPLGQQGRGLGGTFAMMLHVFAFRVLGLDRVYVQPKPENVRVRRLEQRLGYELDSSPEARAFADDDEAITMSITRPAFEEKNASAISDVHAR